MGAIGKELGSCFENLLSVPVKKFLVGLPAFIYGNRDLGTVETIVASSVLELIAKAVTDAKDVIRCDCYISEVIKAMQITAKQQAVIYSVLAASSIGHDMGGL